jgi:ketosteroid isomerase-like protein
VRVVRHPSGLAVLLILAICALRPLDAGEQARADIPDALTQMIDTERAFAARALVIGWKNAFLEFFANDAVGFDDGQAGPARDQVRANPDPPAGLRLIWEPRYGDVAASGELGYLTGPVQNILPSRDKGRPRHSLYASIWKRQRDGSFKVVLDVGVPTPGPVTFAAGFTRAAIANRFTGDYDDNTPPLGTADSVLNSALRTNPATAYRGRLAPNARFHRRNVLPVVGERNAERWLASQRPYALIDTRYSEAARSGDLGYTWGTYAVGPAQKRIEEGFYARAWVRERNGQWTIAMDILQPQ